MRKRSFGKYLWAALHQYCMSDIILTKHAQQRLYERQFTVDLVEQTLRKPDSSRRARQRGAREFVKQFGPSQVTVVAHQNERNQWIVVSCWIDPPVYGTKDWYKRERYGRYKKAPWWQKILMLVGKQLGSYDF